MNHHLNAEDAFVKRHLLYYHSLRQVVCIKQYASSFCEESFGRNVISFAHSLLVILGLARFL
jgi:hypothetical protein